MNMTKEQLRNSGSSDKEIKNITDMVVESLRRELFASLCVSTRCCITCDFFKEQEELCGKYGQRPPARVIAFGCPHYTQQIPF